MAAAAMRRTDALSPEPVGNPAAIATWISGALLFLAVAVGLYLIQVSSVSTAGYEVQRLQAEKKAWQARNEQLELELAKKRSLVWAESQAAERFGMVRAGKPVYVAVDSRVPSPADEVAGIRQRGVEVAARDVLVVTGVPELSEPSSSTDTPTRAPRTLNGGELQRLGELLGYWLSVALSRPA